MRISIFPLVFALFGCSSLGCSGQKYRDVVVIASCSDGGAEEVSLAEEEFSADDSVEAKSLSSPCARACKHLSDLSCPESRKPVGGRTCVETCKTISAISTYSPECVEKAKDVTAVRKCPAIRCIQK